MRGDMSGSGLSASASRIRNSPVLWVRLDITDDQRRAEIEMVELGDVAVDCTAAAIAALGFIAFTAVVIHGQACDVLSCARSVRRFRSKQCWLSITEQVDTDFERAARELGALCVLDFCASTERLPPVLRSLRA